MRQSNWRPSRSPNVLTRAMACTAQTDDGEPCGRPSAPQAPFPICAGHVLSAYKYAAFLLGTQHVVEQYNPEPGKKAGAGRKTATSKRESKGYGMNGWPSVVYYARISDHIKVGHTGNLVERMKWYPPSAVLLALEPGGPEVESRRKDQFRHLLDARNEWFLPGPDLLEHVKALAIAGLPVAS